MMMPVERHPSRTQLLVFGLLWLFFFGAWGTVFWAEGGAGWKPVAFWSLALVVPAAGGVRPGLLRVVYVAAATLTLPLGMLLSWIILMVIYYLVLTPIGLVLRLAGYDPMRRRFDPGASTYWAAREPAAEDDRYFKQF